MDSDTTVKTAGAILVILVGFLFYRFVQPSSSFAADGTDPSWDAAVENRDVDKPTLVIFSAQWCGYCRQLENDVLSRSEIQNELRHRYNVHFVDLTSPTPDVQRHASKLGVSAIPLLIRYDAKGHETDRIHGESAEDLLRWLKAGE
jgi:thiol:disulfide interchange protein